MPITPEGKRRETTEGERWRMVGQLESGHMSLSQVAKRLKVSKSTVHRYEERYKRSNSIQNKKGRGPKRILNDEQSLLLKSFAEEDPSLSYRQLRTKLYTSNLEVPAGRSVSNTCEQIETPMVSLSTIANELKKYNLRH